MTRQAARPSQQTLADWLEHEVMPPRRGATSEGRAEAVMATARMVKRLVNCILMVVGGGASKEGRYYFFVKSKG